MYTCRQTKLLPGLEEALASSAEGQRSTKMPPTSIHKLQMPSECKSKVRRASTRDPCDVSDSLCIGKEAGLAFERAAAIQTKNLNEPDDAANTLTEAFKAYRKTDPEDAARVLQQAISHYTMKGNFRRAATHQQNLAEVYEVEIGDQKRAIEAYEVAAGWFESDNAEA